MAIRLIVVFVLNIVDLIFSLVWINKYGIEVEANPIGRWLYETGLVYPVKTIVVAGLLIALYFMLKAHPSWDWVSWILLAAFVLLTLYHIFILCKISNIK